MEPYIFTNDVLSLETKNTISFNSNKIEFPDYNTMFYLSKEKEIIEQYLSARRTIKRTKWTDFSPFFDSDGVNDNYFKLQTLSEFYESSLFFYNTIIDLSWVVTYSILETYLYIDEEQFVLSNDSSSDNIEFLLRKLEKNIVSLNDPDNPFSYLINRKPEFQDCYDHLIAFWKIILETGIRDKFNYIKHRGHPLYNELYKYVQIPVSFYEFKSGNEKKCILNSNNIRKQYSLYESIDELILFDNEFLYPYISELFMLLKKHVNLEKIVF